MGVVTESPPEVVEQPSPEEAPQEASPDGDGSPQAPDGDEALAPEPVETPPDPITELREELKHLRAAIAERPQRSEADIRAELAQRLREESDAKEQARVREESDREELHESIAAVLVTAGYSDTNPDAVRKVAERFINKRYDQIAQRSLPEMSQAFELAASEVLQTGQEVAATPRARGYAEKLKPFVESIREYVRADITSSGDWVPKADIPKLVQAEIERRSAKANADKQPLRRVEGAPGSVTSDQAWWDGLAPQERRNSANISRYDRYTSSLR